MELFERFVPIDPHAITIWSRQVIISAYQCPNNSWMNSVKNAFVLVLCEWGSHYSIIVHTYKNQSTITCHDLSWLVFMLFPVF